MKAFLILLKVLWKEIYNKISDSLLDNMFKYSKFVQNFSSKIYGIKCNIFDLISPVSSFREWDDVKSNSKFLRWRSKFFNDIIWENLRIAKPLFFLWNLSKGLLAQLNLLVIEGRSIQNFRCRNSLHQLRKRKSRKGNLKLFFCFGLIICLKIL